MSNPDYQRSPELLSAATSRLVIIDVQERFMPTIPHVEELIANCVKLVRGAELMHVPASASEQYPSGLGGTVTALSELLPDPPDKVRFSAAEVLPWAASGRTDGRHQIVLAGLESHVCVLQTAFDLMAAGFDVYVVADAVRSRAARDEKLALRRLGDSGARIVSTEMVLFEWCEIAGTDVFKQVSKLITGRSN